MKKSRKKKGKNPSLRKKPTVSPALNISIRKEPSIYVRNMQVLQKHYPELAEEIKKVEQLNYQIVPSSPGKPVTLLAKKDNLHYYDPADPLRDVQEQLAALKLKNTRLAVFLGFGLGYETLYFAQRMVEEQNTSYLLIIEKDPQIFKAALQATNLEPLLGNPRARFMVGLPEEKLYVEIRNYLAENSRFMFLKAMKPVYHLSALKLHKDYYLDALRQLRESGAHQVLHFGNDPHDSLIGVENMLENLNEIIFNPGINLLFNKFKGKPAIVVSTGPSLNKNKHLLKGLEDKALIISVDASLKILLEMGVRPHLVTSLERVPAVVKLIEGLKKGEVKDVYFAACPVVRNAVYKSYPGPRIIVYRNFDHFKWLGVDRGILNIQLSSGNMAFKVAEALGCDPIVLIGQDLAFGEEGHTHAKGATLGEKQGKSSNKATFEVMGNDGQPIHTKKVWYSFLKAYELDVAGYAGTCINSTEGGAYINGTIVKPFKETIDSYIQKSFFPANIIKENIASFTIEKADKDFYRVFRLIEKTSSDMEEIIGSCKKALQLHDRYQKELWDCLSDGEKLKSFGIRLKDLYDEILAPKRRFAKDYYETFQLFFMHTLQSFNIKFEMEMIAIPEKHETRDAATVEILLRHREWYTVVGELAGVCLDALHKAKEKLEQKLPVRSAH
ncbi:MAG TPA: motility associated factor glycosyltransferase family protein [Firmicutes bacterium]|nr:motility associated factor glycosyltransferase family protein [Bacillota bacterium]